MHREPLPPLRSPAMAKIGKIHKYELDCTYDSHGDFDEVRLTETNLTKIWLKQCELIEAVNNQEDSK